VEARQAIEALRDAVAHELESRLSPENTDKTIPSAETGELGFEPGYDRAFLTITLGLSDSGVKKLALAEPPADLRTIPWSDLLDDGKAPADTGGDLVLQICADSLYICEHVVRRVEEELGDKFALNTAFIGSQRYSTRSGRTSRREGRALIGFLDGTSNLDPRNSDADAKLVFVKPGELDYPKNPDPGPLPGPNPYETKPEDQPPVFPPLNPVPETEPEWTKDGTYMAVRVSTFDTKSWDTDSQDDQEQTIGRFKVSGASLDLPDDPDQLEVEPAFKDDKANLAVSPHAHIRKANPRGGEEDAKRRILRRGYPLIAPGDGELQRGLIFISFGRSITTQFEFIVRAWMRNPDFPTQGAGVDPLFSKIGETILGGGYYFVPPLESRSRPWSWILPDA
jgi:deferrochelatase/peroxidase EfeB